MSVRFTNYAMKTETKHEMDWFEWCIFCPEDAQVLKDIAKVEYRLHPTFKNPIRTTEDIQHRFALYSSGWGEFQVGIMVTRQNGTTDLVNYSLRLGADLWPLSPVPMNFTDTDEESVYRVLTEGSFRWRKTSTICTKTNLAREKAIEVLQGLVDRGFARRLPNPSIDRQWLWGATSIVGATPQI